MAAVTVTKLVRSDYSGHATIKCGKCGLQRRYEATSLTDPVDVYGMLVDEFFKE